MQNISQLPEEALKGAETVARSITIPARPQVVLEIQREMENPEPDLGSIARTISHDVSLSAKVLKIANSPFFSRGKTDSILHALNMLGLRNFNSIVLTLALQEALGGTGPMLGRFWRHSENVATIAAHIAKELRIPYDDQAYITGLFHDCGVPLLLKKFATYGGMSEDALRAVSSRHFSERFESVVGAENDRYATNHCVMGYIMTKSWQLSETVVQVVLQHHNPNVSMHKDDKARQLSAILLLSEMLDFVSGLPVSDASYYLADWSSEHASILREAGMEPASLRELAEETLSTR